MLHKILSRVVSDPKLHGRWLNTFSYLEYVGFKKIVKSQVAPDFETLSHAVEEGRHALLLKKLALRMGGEAVASYEPQALLGAREAADYFHRLDHECAGTARWTYLVVTWLVERRALDVYRIYREFQPAAALEALFKDEEKHLADVEAELEVLDPKKSREGFLPLEKELYEKFLNAVAREVFDA